MSEQFPDPVQLTDAQRLAHDEVNRWRGHCIECFARIEEAIAETLRFLAAPGKPIPRLFGLRLAELEQAVADGGPVSVAGAPTRDTLVKLHPLAVNRNILVHATGEVWVRPRSEWLWRYRFTPVSMDKSVETGCFTSTDADRLEHELSRIGRSLSDHLRNLRNVVPGQ